MNKFIKSIGWWLPILIVMIVTPFSNSLDLSTARLFFTPEGTNHGHFMEGPFVYIFYNYVNYIAVIVSVLAAGMLVLAYLSASYRRWYKPMLLLVLSMAIGGQFIIQNLLKDHWGRPRPRQVIEFGGEAAFRPWYQPNFSADAQQYKSFVCGHCSMGFYFFAFVFIGRRLRKPWLANLGWILAFSLGILLGLARLMAGGHFVTDVLMAGIIMWYVPMILNWLIYAEDQE